MMTTIIGCPTAADRYPDLLPPPLSRRSPFRLQTSSNLLFSCNSSAGYLHTGHQLLILALRLPPLTLLPSLPS
eukprot:746700-Hanusia_phi.AAC.1